MTILMLIILLGLIIAIALLFDISNKPQMNIISKHQQLILQPIFINPIQPQKIEPIIEKKVEEKEKRRPIGFNKEE